MTIDDYFFKELKVLFQEADFKLLNTLKEKKSLSKQDLILAGDIFLTSWRNYC